MSEGGGLYTPSALYSTRKISLLTEPIMQSIAISVSGCSNADMISFSKIKTPEESELLGRFRLQSYSIKNTYMTAEFDKNGFDLLDETSTNYAAWSEGEMIAAIRLTQAPFESSQLFDTDIVINFLGDNYETHYLEWSRLIINHRLVPMQLLPALITYAGLRTLTSTSYRQYFGYCTPVVKKLFSRFLILHSPYPVLIQGRGGKTYQLIKGNFLDDFFNIHNKHCNLEISK